MFVANREGDSVSVIDMKALHVIATVPVGHAPFAFTVSPGGDRLYVTNVQSSDLSVLGAETLETLDTVKVGSVPYGVAVTPNSERVFITNQQSGSVSVMDAEALVVTYKTKVGRYPEGVVIGSKAYVANWASGDISVLNGKPGRSFAASRQAPARAPWLSFPRAKIYPSASMPPGAIALRKSGGHDRLMTKFDGA